ncbi:MAG: hypothetical protein KAG96_05075 [Ichthyobacteriaceae bacterium]|nr:hypothetical protein [Ichthyobacteriaceae bacterium]
MGKFKVAVLEDNKSFLKNLVTELKKTELVDVVCFDTDSERFITKVNEYKPDAVVLDIELDGESIDGIGVADILKLPVLFVSSKTQEFDGGIQDLELNLNVPIRRIAKTKLKNGLNFMLNKLISDVKGAKALNYIDIKLKEGYINVAIDSIVYIGTSKKEGSESNNKQIFFKDRKPGLLVDFSFKTRADKGFSTNQFIMVQKSYCVNKNCLPSGMRNLKTIVVEVFGKKEKIPISKEMQEIKAFF